MKLVRVFGACIPEQRTHDLGVQLIRLELLWLAILVLC